MLVPKSLYPEILLISFKLACKELTGGNCLQNARGSFVNILVAPCEGHSDYYSLRFTLELHKVGENKAEL